MTDILERVSVATRRVISGEPPHLNRHGEICTTSTHWTTHSYSKGCRGPVACAEQKTENDRRTAVRREYRVGGVASASQYTIVSPSPECAAPVHKATNQAWHDGCRCEGAEVAHERALETQRRAMRRSRYGGDPREKWIAPAMRVGRSDLWMLLHGVPATDRLGRGINTRAEQMVAVIHMRKRVHRSGFGWTEHDIAAALAVHPQRLNHLKAMPAKLREQRTQRRLAWATWRAQRNTRLTGTATGVLR